ncbi:caspase family protein [Candidatus Obscuribacterales bacterium]|nr:caspase family protein [Candidatus Obscuribacterales bacterium]
MFRNIVAANILPLALSVGLAWTFCSIPSAGLAAEDTSAKEKFAVVIGIDDYINGDPWPGHGDLGGCVNDANSIEELLVSRGFSKDKITKLLNEQATREGILKALDKLVDDVSKNRDAVVVFSYAGHGDQVTDENGDEEDGLDETIVPADVKMNNRGDSTIKDITDDEIEERFSKLAKLTKNITFIFDSCHSGSPTRNVQAPPKGTRVRRLPESERKQMRIAAAASRRGTTVDSDNGFLDRSKSYVALSGCRSDQESGETMTEPAHGVMTASLLAALADAPKNATYRQIYEDLRGRALRDAGAQGVMNAPQEPQIEGDLDRVFLGEAGNRGERFFRIDKVNGTTLTIPAGRSGAISEGTQVAIYSADAPELKGSKGLLAKAKIVSVGPTSSDILLSKALEEDVLKNARVVIVTPSFGTKTLPIAIDTSFDTNKSVKNFSSKLQESLKTDPVLKLSFVGKNPFEKASDKDWQLCVATKKYSDFVKLLPEKDEPTTRAGGNIPSDESDTLVSYVSYRSGLPIFNYFVPVADADSSTEVLKVLERKIKQDNVSGLKNLRSDLKEKISIEFLKIRDVDGKEVEEPMTEEEKAGASHFPKKSKYKIRVTNNADFGVYVTALIVGTRGGITVVYPPEGGAEKISAGSTFYTKTLQAEGPLGTDVYKFIITTKKADFSFLEQDGVSVRAIASRGAEEEKDSSPLVGMLKHNLGFGTRDISESNPDPDEWDTVSRTVIVDPEIKK